MILEHKGTSIFYSDMGHGDVTVLLHGFLENSKMWKNLTPKLSESNRIISMDLLGHGETGSLGYVHTMEMMAEAVAAIIDHLKLEKITLIGHSMGGYVALAYAEAYPAKINGICLMNSTAQADSYERKINRDRAILAVKQNSKAFIGMSVSNLFASENRDRLIDEISEVKKEALKMPLQGIIAALEGMKIRKDRTNVLQRYDVKKMMIVGRRDPVLDFDALMNQTKDMDVEIVEFQDGHMSHIENIYELTYNLLRFIEK
ncbi:MAG: alpha/beta fold hydrolase [Aquaticitalea sp.]